MSPSEAPESDEPYWATACFSSEICSALIEKFGLLRPVEADHQRVELLADLEALGALLVAVAAEIGALDEARSRRRRRPGTSSPPSRTSSTVTVTVSFLLTPPLAPAPPLATPPRSSCFMPS
jgi:hypothetical protein